jgi:hypothetical protein
MIHDTVPDYKRLKAFLGNLRVIIGGAKSWYPYPPPILVAKNADLPMTANCPKAAIAALCSQPKTRTWVNHENLEEHFLVSSYYIYSIIFKFNK